MINNRKLGENPICFHFANMDYSGIVPRLRLVYRHSFQNYAAYFKRRKKHRGIIFTFGRPAYAWGYQEELVNRIMAPRSDIHSDAWISDCACVMLQSADSANEPWTTVCFGTTLLLRSKFRGTSDHYDLLLCGSKTYWECMDPTAWKWQGETAFRVAVHLVWVRHAACIGTITLQEPRNRWEDNGQWIAAKWDPSPRSSC